jgi:uncharacterized membrane protein
MWAPGPRVLAGGAGAALVLLGAGRRDLAGMGIGAAGLLLLARALSNEAPVTLLGFGGPDAVAFHKTITVMAPVEEVYAFWRRVENFPRVMSHVREVRDSGAGRSHWQVVGPAGAAVEWDAAITQAIPNRLLAWESLPGQAIRNAGRIQFEPAPGGGTRLDIRLAYSPPAGALGHAVAALFGTDPKRAMDDDLVRFKSFLEHGKATVHGTTVTRAELDGGRPADGPPSAPSGP